MRKLSEAFIIVAAISLIVGIISRLMVRPFFGIGLEAGAFLQFSIACLLFAIAIGIRELFIAKGK